MSLFANIFIIYIDRIEYLTVYLLANNYAALIVYIEKINLRVNITKIFQKIVYMKIK